MRRNLIPATAIGAATFAVLFGPGVLDPRNVGWLAFGDSPTQQLGWEFYRQQPWTWPLGLLPSYGMELGGSIVYTDSIPLLAIPFKLLSPMLPPTFQYFGLWILLCLVLQAHFAWRILSLFVDSLAAVAAGTTMLSISPIMLWRLSPEVSQWSLGGQFTLLAALYLTLRPWPTRQWLWWFVLLTATTAIHAYLLVMATAVWVADLVQRRHERKTSSDAIRSLLLPPLGILGTALATGYFVVGAGVLSGGFGYFKASPVAFIDPGLGIDEGVASWRWSQLLPDLPPYTQQIEGFNYLGLGVLLLLALAAFSAPSAADSAVRAIRRWPWLAVMLALLGMFALSNRIGGEHTYIEVPLPQALEELANIFRASGRMLWLSTYALTLFAIIVVVRIAPRKLGLGLLIACVCVQVWDTSPAWSRLHRVYSATAAARFMTAPEGEFWNEATERYRTIRTLPFRTLNPPVGWGALSSLALQHDMGTDAVYLARIDVHRAEQRNQTAMRWVRSGCYPKDTLFIVQPEVAMRVRQSLDPSRDLLTTVDGMVVLAPGWYDDSRCSSRN